MAQEHVCVSVSVCECVCVCVCVCACLYVQVYTRLDADGSGGLDFDEFKSGIKGLPNISKIHITMQDFRVNSENEGS